jgi:ABC-2 type transport system ATP-binding protein
MAYQAIPLRMGRRRRGKDLTRRVTVTGDLDAEGASEKHNKPGGVAALVVDDLSFAYTSTRMLDEVSFAVGDGRFTALLGPNGAGKTTLFSLITGLLEPRQGDIRISGHSLRASGWRSLASLGIVFQQPTLDLDLTVRQNLLYFARLRGMPRADAEHRITRELERLGMAERASEKVRALNSGHRRRVEIARALLHDPDLLLLDEATVGLDFATRRSIVAHVHDLAEQRGIGILWATHLIDEVQSSDDLVVLHRGRVVASGLAEDVIARTGARSLDQAFARLTSDGTNGA